MAPLTRNRAIEPNTVPSPLAPLYYRQRATAGLLITEATQISQQGQGYVWTPGMLHRRAGRRLAQGHRRRARGRRPDLPAALARRPHLAHQSCSRTAARRSRPPRSPPRPRPSSRAASPTCRRRARWRPLRSPASSPTTPTPPRCARPRRLRRRRDPRRQRLSDRPVPARRNQQAHRRLRRLDREPAALRARSGRRRADGAGRPTRVGIRMSPVSPANDIVGFEPAALFGALVEELGKRKLAYHPRRRRRDAGRARHRAVRLRRAAQARSPAPTSPTTATRAAMAIEAVKRGRADMVAFGRSFISNPDLVERLRDRRAARRGRPRDLSTAAAPRATRTIPTCRRPPDGRRGASRRRRCASRAGSIRVCWKSSSAR